MWCIEWLISRDVTEGGKWNCIYRIRKQMFVGYLSNLEPSRIWYKVILMWWARHESRLMRGRHQKRLILSTFLYWDASGVKQWTRPYKAGIAWGNGLFGPGESDEKLYITYSGRVREDSVLCSVGARNILITERILVSRRLCMYRIRHQMDIGEQKKSANR